MCTDRTIQRHLFLKALVLSGDVSVRNQVAAKMEKESKDRYGSVDFALSPETLDTVLRKCTDIGFVEQVSPTSWKITRDGLEAIEYMEKNYLPEIESA